MPSHNTQDLTAPGKQRNILKKLSITGRNQAQARVNQVTDAEQALGHISESVDNINRMNSQIATAGQQQSTVAEEINRNISNISEVADQTTTDAEQIAASGTELAQLAERLRVSVRPFKFEPALLLFHG